jgi:hypothetical protein
MKEQRGEERGSAMMLAIIALLFLVGVSLFAAKVHRGSSEEIRKRDLINKETNEAQGIAATAEASIRTDIPTSYTKEVFLARQVTGTSQLKAFDKAEVTDSRPIYETEGWQVTHDRQGYLVISGQRSAYSGSQATSLLGNLQLWLKTHKELPREYVAHMGYVKESVVAVLEKAYEILPPAPPGGIQEPIEYIRFAVDAKSGEYGSARSTGTFILGVTGAAAAPCVNGSISTTITANPPSVIDPTPVSLRINYINSNRVIVRNLTTNTSILNQLVPQQGAEQTLNVDAGTINQNTTFEVRATNAEGCEASTNVTVSYCSSPTVTLNAQPSTVTPGESSTLSWTSTNASGVTITGPNGYSFSGGPNGTTTVSPEASSTYTITTIKESSGCPSATATTTITYCPTQMPVIRFTATPSEITSGQSTTLSWSVTNVSKTATLTLQQIGKPATNVANPGSLSLRPTINTSYTLRVVNGCAIKTAMVAIIVNPSGPPPPDGGSQGNSSRWCGTSGTPQDGRRITVDAFEVSAGLFVMMSTIQVVSSTPWPCNAPLEFSFADLSMSFMVNGIFYEAVPNFTPLPGSPTSVGVVLTYPVLIPASNISQFGPTIGITGNLLISSPTGCVFSYEFSGPANQAPAKAACTW